MGRRHGALGNGSSRGETCRTVPPSPPILHPPDPARPLRARGPRLRARLLARAPTHARQSMLLRMINCRVLAVPSQAFYEAGGHDVPAKVTTALCTACRHVACRSLARRPCSCSRAVLATQALRLDNLGSDTPTDGQAPAGFPAGRGSFDERQHREHREPDCFVPGAPAAGAARQPTRSSTARSVGTMSTAARRRQIAPASAVSARAQNTNKLAAVRAGTLALLKSLTKRHGQIPYKKWVLFKSVLLTGEMGTPGIT